jgi:hypothetical protein
VQGAEKVIPLQAKLPEGPCPTSVVCIVHPLAAGCSGYGV